MTNPFLKLAPATFVPAWGEHTAGSSRVCIEKSSLVDDGLFLALGGDLLRGSHFTLDELRDFAEHLMELATHLRKALPDESDARGVNYLAALGQITYNLGTARDEGLEKAEKVAGE